MLSKPRPKYSIQPPTPSTITSNQHQRSSSRDHPQPQKPTGLGSASTRVEVVGKSGRQGYGYLAAETTERGYETEKLVTSHGSVPQAVPSPGYVSEGLNELKPRRLVVSESHHRSTQESRNAPQRPPATRYSTTTTAATAMPLRPSVETLGNSSKSSKTSYESVNSARLKHATIPDRGTTRSVSSPLGRLVDAFIGMPQRRVDLNQMEETASVSFLYFQSFSVHLKPHKSC